jgi:hypothetical protein
MEDSKLVVPPQDHQVGDTVYMDWFCEHELIGGCFPRDSIVSVDHDRLKVTSIAGWNREGYSEGSIGWKHPGPIPGSRKYLITIPEGLETYHVAASFSWPKDATAQVVEVLS